MFIGGCIIKLVCDALGAIADITCQTKLALLVKNQDRTKLAAIPRCGLEQRCIPRLELGLNKGHWMTNLILILVKLQLDGVVCIAAGKVTRSLPGEP